MPSTPTVPSDVSDVAVRVTGRATPHVIIAGFAGAMGAAFLLRAAYWWDAAIGVALIALALLHLVIALSPFRATVASLLARHEPADASPGTASDRATDATPEESTVVAVVPSDVDPLESGADAEPDLPPDTAPTVVVAAEGVRPVRADVTVILGDAASSIPVQRTGAPAAIPAQRSGPGSSDDRLGDDDEGLGERLSGARQRAGLTVAMLAERTSIRTHVIEAMERGDFSACGGDFYARGHLAGIARCLGLDAEPLVEAFDASYAYGAQSSSDVFETELAGGLVDTARGGGRSRWSLVAAAVVSLAVVWGLAHLLGDEGEQLLVAPPSAPAAGLAGNQQPIVSPRTETTRITVRARGAAVRVVVRDRDATVVWSGDLRAGERRRLAGVAPFRVRADNGKAVDVLINGARRGTVGSDDGPAVRTFAARP